MRIKVTKITKKCQHCGNPFECYPIDGLRRKCCSPSCGAKNRHKPFLERFWNAVDKNGPIPSHRPELGQCWVWTKAHHNFGYGFIKDDEGNQRYAHRISWKLHNGDIPINQNVLHKCDNAACINPNHLFLGTQGDNNRDTVVKLRDKRCLTLSDEQVRQIRSLKGILSHRQIAAKFNTARSNVWTILHFKTRTRERHELP